MTDSVGRMSDHEQEQQTEHDDDGDDLTPDDLKPGEDNPLAEPLEEDEAREDLDVLGGKTPEENEDDDDAGAAREDDSEEE